MAVAGSTPVLATNARAEHAASTGTTVAGARWPARGGGPESCRVIQAGVVCPHQLRRPARVTGLTGSATVRRPQRIDAGGRLALSVLLPNIASPVG